MTLRRHVLSFFQGNRFLLRRLAEHVSGLTEPNSTVVDLYAGVGLFAVAVAASRDARVTAVEGDRTPGLDLLENAQVLSGAVEVVRQSVEEFCARQKTRPDLAIVDPPRTGISKMAMTGLVKMKPPRIVYVSCDVATLARDTRALMDAGYTLHGMQAFDLFPNTPHIETVVELRMK
jgi:23S rRNA (uracil1939-C5)-methyltransferase